MARGLKMSPWIYFEMIKTHYRSSIFHMVKFMDILTPPPLGSLLLNIILVNKVYVIKLLANPNPLTVHLVYGCPLMTFFDKVMQLSTWANHWMYRHLNRFTHSAMNFETILFPIFQNAKVKIVICEKDQIHAKLFLNFNFLRSVRF